MAGNDQELAPGSRVDRYEVLGLLGGGGFGLVYAARHLHLGQTVALKLLRPGLVDSPQAVERFFREARAAAAVGNPHIVEILDCGVVGSGQPFIAMELLEGTTLDKLLVRGSRLGQERAVDVALQILDGLAAAHAAGIVHRDLKPANIFLQREPGSGGDFVKILDFGASKVQQHALEKALTRTGAWVGTPAYMAPEQFLGARDVDGRADLYAVAAVLFEMLTGRLPIIGRTAGELAELVLTTRHATLSDLVPGLPAGLVAVVDRGLAKAPEARWPGARGFAEALRDAMGMRVPIETGATLMVAAPTTAGAGPGPSTGRGTPSPLEAGGASCGPAGSAQVARPGTAPGFLAAPATATPVGQHPAGTSPPVPGARAEATFEALAPRPTPAPLGVVAPGGVSPQSAIVLHGGASPQSGMVLPGGVSPQSGIVAPGGAPSPAPVGGRWPPGRWLLLVALVGGLAGMLGGGVVAGVSALVSALSSGSSSSGGGASAGGGGGGGGAAAEGLRSVSGVVSTPGQRVPLPLRLTSPALVTVTVMGQGLDPTVRVVDSAGTQLGFDDDSGGGLNSRLVLQLAPGSYSVEVGGYGSSTGAFTCTMQ